MEGAKGVLRHNLSRLMKAHPTLNSRKAIETRTDVSARTVGYMLQEEGPSPTLTNLEAVAGAFHLEVWELLSPELDISKVAVKVPPSELALHKRIEADMRKLGVKEYRLRGK